MFWTERGLVLSALLLEYCTTSSFSFLPLAPSLDSSSMISSISGESSIEISSMSEILLELKSNNYNMLLEALYSSR